MTSTGAESGSIPLALEELEDLPTHSGRASLSHLPPIGHYGRYDLLGRLAYGGMAEIFLAREVGTEARRGGRFVVVKRVLPHVAEESHFVDMFVDEARLAMHLAHPNICHVYDFGQEEGTYFISMEWVNGMPLSKTVRRAREAGGVPVAVALKIIAHVAEALDHAHRATDQLGEPLGIVHRDVSPQNVMIGYDGVVKLLDFGIAKAASHSTRTEAGVIKGKFAYMSPQQCLGEPIDARADVFALGVCLYEVLTGRNPWKRQTEFDTMRALVYEDAPPLEDLIAHRVPSEAARRALAEVAQRATAKRVEERFQSASDMQIELERVIAQTGEVVTSAHVAETMARLFENEIKAGPQLDVRISVPPKRATVASSGDHDLPNVPPPPNATLKVDTVSAAHADAALAPPRRRSWAAVALALLVIGGLGVVGIGAAFMLGRASSDLPGPLAILGAPPLPMPPPVPPTSVATAPTSATPTPIATGSIFVTSEPSHATIELGDRGEVGTTPMEIALVEPGRATLRLVHEGYVDWEGEVLVQAGERAEVHGALDEVSEARRPRAASRRATSAPPSPPRSSATGLLSVNSRPWSRVFVGERALGATPLGDLELPAGRVQLRLVDRDGEEHTRVVTIPEGGHAREFFDLRAGE